MKFKKFLFLIFVSQIQYGFSQNSLVGDGFGGRLWYKPFNYTVGSYSGYSVCGSNFQLYGWGQNSFGQLGNGNKTVSITPVQALGMTNVQFYTCGYIMAVIRCDNSGWVWGSGNPTQLIPVQVITNAKFVDAGSHSVSFVRNDKTVWSVGNNIYGEFGNGLVNATYSLTPFQMNNITNAVRVANGQRTITVLLGDGTVMTCGSNVNGCLGNNSATSNVVKTAIKVDSLRGIRDIKANAITVIALDSNGDVYQWGRRSGTGPTVTDLYPKKIKQLKNIVAISGMDDGYHFLAIDSARNCYGWGGNRGYFGGGSSLAIDTPMFVATDVVDILAGELFSYIIKSDGSLWASGTNLPIWMNLTAMSRNTFTKLDPSAPPMNLCNALPFRAPAIFNDTLRICAGDSAFIKGKYYKPNSFYKDSILHGTCSTDTFYSTAIVTDTKGVQMVQNIMICPGDTFSFGTHKYFIPAAYHDTSVTSSGCLKFITTNLSFVPVVYGTQNVKVCPGDTFKFVGHKYFTPGSYLDTVVSHIGCDSVVTTNLSFNAVYNTPQLVKLCPYDTFKFNGHKYYIPGIYVDGLKSKAGCDSLVTTEIKILAVSNFSQSAQICTGNSFACGIHKYTKTGIYKDTLKNSVGCDSIISTNLSVTPPPYVIQKIEICKGDTFTIGVHQYTTSGTYSESLKNALGCDSIVTTQLIVNAKPVVMLPYDTILCEEDLDTLLLNAGLNSNYLWQPNGETTQHIKVFKAGNYSVTVGNSSNCYSSAAVKVINLCHPWLFVPNAFSPDANGTNDNFKPIAEFILTYQMIIYNRWGAELFRTDEISKGWDGTFEGKAAQEDIYIYAIEAEGTFNKTFHKKGTFHLIR